jgi:hypothetical protein
MTLSEFKAWLEGYGASFKDGVPSADQWTEVQKRLSDVQPLSFGLYGPRPEETMTKPVIVGPYYSPSVPTSPARPYDVTCITVGDLAAAS